MLIPESEWPSLRRRAQSQTFKAAVRRLRRDVDAFVDRPVDVPSEPAGYYHDYFCAEHGCQLTFNPATPKEHRCPVDGAQYEGARYDAAWRWSANNLLSESAIRLALPLAPGGGPGLPETRGRHPDRLRCPVRGLPPCGAFQHKPGRGHLHHLRRGRMAHPPDLGVRPGAPRPVAGTGGRRPAACPCRRIPRSAPLRRDSQLLLLAQRRHRHRQPRAGPVRPDRLCG